MTIRLERTTDVELIKRVVTDPAVYPHASDDYSPSPAAWEPLVDDCIWYVKASDGDELLGLWMFHPENAICWKVHTCLLPNAYGARAKVAAKMMAEWLWDHTPCQRLVTDVPAFNRLAFHFARRAGMEQFGVNPKSFMKNGQLHDQILLGMSRSEPCQQPSD